MMKQGIAPTPHATIGRRLREFRIPPDLLEISSAERWWFPSGRGSEMVDFSWTRTMDDGTTLLDEQNSDSLELLQRYFCCLRSGMNKSAYSYAMKTVTWRVQRALSIRNWIMSKGFKRLADFRSADFARCKEEILFGFGGTRQIITSSYIAQILEVFKDLHELFATASEDGFHELNDGFAYQLFSETEAAALIARGATTGRTDDVPSEVAFGYIDAATEYVMDHSEAILALRDRAKALRSAPVVSNRARQGARKLEVANHLLAVVKGTAPLELFNGRLNKKRIAKSLNLRPGNLHPELVELAEKALFGSDAKVREKVVSRLTQMATRELGSPNKYHLAKTVNETLGLPFWGAAGAGYVPWPIVSIGRSPSGGYSVDHAEQDLWTATLAVILAFDAGRIDETMALDADCIVKGADGYYLRTRIFKENDTEGGSEHLKPCPELVVRAVQVAQKLGESARRASGSTKLFFSEYDGGVGVPPYHTVRNRLIAFGKRTGAALMNDGELWELVPHELRRFFVTMWVDYYEYGGRFESCRRMLSHAWIGTTIRYGTSASRNEGLSKAMAHLTHRVMKSAVFEGLRNVIGAAAIRMNKLVQRLRIRARSETEIIALIENRIEHHQVEVHPMPWGYCVWDVFAGLKARCATAGEKRSHVKRPSNRKKPEACVGCACFWSNPQFSPFWEHAEDRHRRIAANPAAPDILVAAANSGIDVVRRYAEGIVHAAD